MGVDLRNKPGALARERHAARAAASGPGAVSAPQDSGSRALVPRQGGAANHGQFGLVYKGTEANESNDTSRDELVQVGA